MYLTAMSLYNQIPDITRDQERAEKALVIFSKLIEKFPKSEYVDDSKFKIHGRARPARGQGNVR